MSQEKRRPRALLITHAGLLAAGGQALSPAAHPGTPLYKPKPLITEARATNPSHHQDPWRRARSKNPFCLRRSLENLPYQLLKGTGQKMLVWGEGQQHKPSSPQGGQADLSGPGFLPSTEQRCVLTRKILTRYSREVCATRRLSHPVQSREVWTTGKGEKDPSTRAASQIHDRVQLPLVGQAGGLTTLPPVPSKSRYTAPAKYQGGQEAAWPPNKSNTSNKHSGLPLGRCSSPVRK